MNCVKQRHRNRWRPGAVIYLRQRGMVENRFAQVTYRNPQTGQMHRNGLLHVDNQQFSFASESCRVPIMANMVTSLVFQNIGAIDSRHRHMAMVEVMLSTGLSHQFIGLGTSDLDAFKEIAQAYNVPIKETVASYSGQNWGQLTTDAQRLMLTLDAPERTEFRGAPIFDFPVMQVVSATVNGNELLVQFRPEQQVRQACRIVSATFVGSDKNRMADRVRGELSRHAKIGDEHALTAVTFHSMSMLQPVGEYELSLTGTGLLAERYNDDDTIRDEINIQYSDIASVIKLVDYESPEAAVICVCLLRPSCSILTGPNAGFLIVRFDDVGTAVTLPVRGHPTRVRVTGQGEERHREQHDVFELAGLKLIKQDFDRELAEDEDISIPEGQSSVSVDVISDEAHEVFTKLLAAFNSQIRVHTLPPTLMPDAEPEPNVKYTTAIRCNHNGKGGVLYFGRSYVLFLCRPTLLIYYDDIERLVINQRSSTDTSLFSIMFHLHQSDDHPRRSVLQTKSLRVEFGHLLTKEDLPRLEQIAERAQIRVEHLRSEDMVVLDRLQGSLPDDDDDDDFDVDNFNAEHAESMAEDEEDDQMSGDAASSDSDADRRTRKPRAGQARQPKQTTEELGHRLDKFGLDLSDD